MDPRIQTAPTALAREGFAPTPKAEKRFREFFTTQVSNDHTRRAWALRSRCAWRTISCRDAVVGFGCMRRAGSCTRSPAITTSKPTLEQYISAGGIAEDHKGPLFRTAVDRSGKTLTGNGLWQQDTSYLKNGGRLETAQQMANHESARTTGLYDRRNDDVSLDEVERIGI